VAALCYDGVEDVEVVAGVVQEAQRLLSRALAMKGDRKARQGIVSRLRAGQTVGEWEELSAYPDGGYFVVGLLPEGQLDMRGLTQEQARQLAEEGEVSEYLDTPEEAADLYLKWNEDYGGALARAQETRPRSARATAIPVGAGGNPARERGPSRLRDFHGGNFEREVLEAPVPVLAFFCQPLSASDRLLLPLLERLAAEYTGLRFGRVDVGQNDALAVEYGVDTVPACLLFKHGRLVSTLKGLQRERHLRAALDALLA
jgi:thioredoxin 1